MTDAQSKAPDAEMCLEGQQTGTFTGGNVFITTHTRTHARSLTRLLAHSLTCVRRLAGVPDEDASVIGGAGEDVVVDGADGQTVDGVDVQEHVHSFPPAPGKRPVSHSESPTHSRGTICQRASLLTAPRREGSPARHFLGGKKEQV